MLLSPNASGPTRAAGRILCALLVAAASAAANGLTLRPPTAGIEIDAGTVEGRISRMLYGQFAEFMFEGGAHVSSSAVVKRVVADSLAAVNGFATPDAVRVTGASIRAGNSFFLDLPRHSVSVVTLTIRPDPDSRPYAWHPAALR
jgi:hypothetical protein